MQNPNNTYTELLTSAKKVARDIARARWIANLSQDRKHFENNIEDQNARLDRQRKDLEKAEFNAKHAEEIGDPEAPELRERAQHKAEQVAEVEEEVAFYTKKNQREIDSINKEIEEVAEGTRKVNYDKMADRAKELVTEHYKAQFVNQEFEAAADGEE